jgi:S1-C subfamily serine protease
VVGTVSMKDGRTARVALVGPRSTPKGAVLIVSESDNQVSTLPLADNLSLLEPASVIEALCMQERLFGESGLTPPELS